MEDDLLLETGDFLLQEDGLSMLILEDSPAGSSSSSSSSSSAGLFGRPRIGSALIGSCLIGSPFMDERE